MFFASILPALIACVLGVDESVVHLASTSNVTLPFIGLWRPQSVLLGNAIIPEGSPSTSTETGCYVDVRYLAPNTDFALPFLFVPRPQSVSYENVVLREGSISKPCETGEPCYQSITDREYGLVDQCPNCGKGIIFAYPIDKTKSPSAIIVQKKGEASADPSIPVGVGVIERIEMDPTDCTQVLIWYADRVQDSRISENIEFLHRYDWSTNRYVYTTPYLYEGTKGTPLLILTGRLRSTTMDYKFTFFKSNCLILRLVPGDVLSTFPTTIRVAFSGVYHLKPWKLVLCLLPAIITTAMP